MNENIEHFFRLALAGKHKGCTTNERLALHLCMQIHSSASGLDAAAIEGASEWLKMCSEMPATARQYVQPILAKKVKKS